MTHKSELLRQSIGWLNSNPHIEELLSPNGGIITAGVASGPDDAASVENVGGELVAVSSLDPRIVVGASAGDSERRNLHLDSDYELRVVVDATRDYVETEHIIGLTELKDACMRTLQAHRPTADETQSSWGAEGVLSDEEILWADAANRYRGVFSVGFTRDDRWETATNA